MTVYVSDNDPSCNIETGFKVGTVRPGASIFINVRPAGGIRFSAGVTYKVMPVALFNRGREFEIVDLRSGTDIDVKPKN